MKYLIIFLLLTISVMAATPDILNSASFENGDLPNVWDGFTDGGGINPPSGNVQRSTDFAHGGSYSLKFVWDNNTADVSSQTFYIFGARNHVWVRAWFYQTAWPNGAGYKFGPRFWDAGGNIIAGVQTIYGHLAFIPAAPQWIAIDYITPNLPATNAWHCLEYELDYPNQQLRFWLDDVQLSNQGIYYDPDNMTSWTGQTVNVGLGRLIQPAMIDIVRVINPATNSGAAYFDDISISTLGRIGCNATAPVDTTPPVISNGQPVGNLSAGTTSTIMNVTTNEAATCAYSTTPGTAYSSMTKFSTTGATIHSTTISGLQGGTSYSYYVRCNDTAGNANTQDYNVSFGVALSAPNVLSASFENGDSPDFWDGFSNGGGSPPGPATGTDTNLTRNNSQAYFGNYSVKYSWGPNVNDSGAAFRYTFSSAYDELWYRFYYRLAPGWSITSIQKFMISQQPGWNTQLGGWELDSGAGFTWSFYQEAGALGTSIVPVANITTGTWHCLEADYRRNGDALPNAAFWSDGNQITQPDGPILSYGTPTGLSWSGGRLYAGPRGSSAQIGHFWFVGTRNGGNTGSGSLWLDGIAVSSVGRIGCGNATSTPDTTPPVISNGQPSGNLSAGTMSTIMNVTTDEAATCRYSTTPNTAYSSVTNTFTGTGTSHSATIIGLTDGQSYNYYARCNDTAGNVDMSDYTVSFKVGYFTSNVVSDASFELGDSPNQWDGFTNGGGGNPTPHTLDTAQHYGGSYAVKRVLPVTSGSDIGGSFYKQVGSYDRIWSRFYFYFNATMNGTLKFHLFFDPSWNTQLGGIGIQDGYINFSPLGFTGGGYSEWDGQGYKLVPLSNLTNGWHSIEVDYWRNGDTGGNVITTGDGEPSIAIWIDGNQITAGNGTPPTSSHGNGYWKNNRIYVGARTTSAQFGWAEWAGVLNGMPANTIPTSLWLDCISISSLGRIGPGSCTLSSDTTSPIISNGQPSGNLSAGTTSIIMNVTTDEVATCKYSATPNTTYASMTSNFAITGGTAHSTTINGLQNGTPYSYYVRCNDTSGNADTQDYSISFSVTQSQPSQDFPLTNECSSYQPGWIWCDDFEQNRLSSYFEYNNNAGNFSRVLGVGTNGSTGMRAIYTPGGSQMGYLSLAFGRTPSSYFKPVDSGTTDYQEVYWRFYFKNQPGWTGGGGDKLSRAIVFATSNWAEGPIGHFWSGSTNSEYLLLDPATGINLTTNLLQAQVYNDINAFTWLGWGIGQTPIFNNTNVGKWRCIEIHMKLNTPGSSDGIFEYWIDGNQEARKTGMNWRGTWTGYGINDINLENYWNAGSPVVQERYWDNYVVSTQRIGCGNATGLSPPSQRPGDLNDDGKVDFLDLLIVITDFRHTTTSIANTRADINNDGTVNLFDFVLLARNWGKVYS